MCWPCRASILPAVLRAPMGAPTAMPENLLSCALVLQRGVVAGMIRSEQKEGRAKLIQDFRVHENDSGSAEVQIALLTADILRHPLKVVDGTLAIPSGPGLGIEVDETKLRGLVDRSAP